MQDYHKLQVWQKSHQLTLRVYRVTTAFPKSEVFGITGQMRRAAASIEMNIAEGCGRDSAAELARFLRIALGSASELECQTEIARDLGYLTQGEAADWLAHATEIKRMLTGLLKRLKTEN
ncbi:MAG: four helix bundle protein [Verrucomicrobia bacterium]|nr:four helix bundle protein [Verrucomicrobiota bacterium]